MSIRGIGNRRILGPPQTNFAKDRDEDLLLFRDMQKCDKERTISLLQPVSDDFESTGNYQFYRMSSGKKGFGIDFLTGSDKNDYDWLKTPPATPLFASLEMEACPEMATIQKEIPILQPLSRFSGGNANEAPNMMIGRSKSPNPNPKPKIPSRSITPSTTSRRNINNISSTNTTATAMDSSRNITKRATSTTAATTTTLLNQKMTTTPKGIAANSIEKSSNGENQHYCDLSVTPSTKPAAIVVPNIIIDSSTNSNSRRKPKSRGVSPLVGRSNIFPGFSEETPANLRTDRPPSATRGRPLITNPKQQENKMSSTPRRQSCSPSMSRGRKQQEIQGGNQGGNGNGNGSLVFGSKMVEKVMNARKFEEISRETNNNNNKHKVGIISSSANANASVNKDNIGRMMSKSSLDTARRQMEVKQDPITTKSRGHANSSTTGRTTQSHDTAAAAGRNQESGRRRETRKYPTKQERANSNCGLC